MTDRRELPPPPPPEGTGYDWILDLGPGWRPVPAWGEGGWDLGAWPEVVVAHYDGEDVHGFASFVEGDLRYESFPTEQARDEHTDRFAAGLWRHGIADGPPDLPEADDDLPSEYRGPFSTGRLARGGGLR